MRKAHAAKGKFGSDFHKLHFEGDITGFTHPDGTLDPSRADYRYLSLLAFWCGKDKEQMARIARQSAIYRPERWDTGKYFQRSMDAAIRKRETVYSGPVQQPPLQTTDTGGEESGPNLLVLLQRIMSHKEISANRRIALFYILCEYHRNVHQKDENGFVPICYRLMEKLYHISAQSLGDAGKLAEKYGLLEKRSKQNQDMKTELRIKPTPGFAVGDFPPLEKTKRQGGKRYACPSCSMEEATIKKRTTLIFICRNPECDKCDAEQELMSVENQRRQKTPKSKKAKEAAKKESYQCTVSSNEEENEDQECQVDASGGDESWPMEQCDEQQPETREVLPCFDTGCQLDMPTDNELIFQEEDHEQGKPIIAETHTIQSPPTCDSIASQFDSPRDSIEPVSQEYSAGKRRPITPKDIQDINGLQNFVGKLESSGLPMGVKACSICGSVIWNNRTKLCAICFHVELAESLARNVRVA